MGLASGPTANSRQQGLMLLGHGRAQISDKPAALPLFGGDNGRQVASESSSLVSCSRFQCVPRCWGPQFKLSASTTHAYSRPPLCTLISAPE